MALIINDNTRIEADGKNGVILVISKIIKREDKDTKELKEVTQYYREYYISVEAALLCLINLKGIEAITNKDISITEYITEMDKYKKILKKLGSLEELNKLVFDKVIEQKNNTQNISEEQEQEPKQIKKIRIKKNKK